MHKTHSRWAFQVVLVVKNPPAKAGDMRDTGLIPGSGRPPGGGNSHPLQSSCLENPMDKGVAQAIVHGPWGCKDPGVTEQEHTAEAETDRFFFS